MLDRHHYQLLIELDRRRSVTAAAAALCITQSAASQRLKEAERRLGVALTNPRGRSVVLTQAARRLIDGGSQAEQTLERAEAEARWLGGGQRLSLRIGVGNYDNVGWLDEFFAKIEDLRVDCSFQLVRCSADQFASATEDGLVDVVVEADATSTAHSHHLFSESLVGIVAVHHELAGRPELTPSDLEPFDYATYSMLPEEGFEQAHFFRAANLFPSRVTVMESTSAILTAVRTGRFVTILSPWATLGMPGLRTVPLMPAPPPLRWMLKTKPEIDVTYDEMVSTLGTAIQRWQRRS